MLQSLLKSVNVIQQSQTTRMQQQSFREWHCWKQHNETHRYFWIHTVQLRTPASTQSYIAHQYVQIRKFMIKQNYCQTPEIFIAILVTTPPRIQYDHASRVSQYIIVNCFTNSIKTAFNQILLSFEMFHLLILFLKIVKRVEAVVISN
ncbi:Hypothetical_protein [Hexamita inflata]|uniref:Hypothetical_protein n=1 Tax=Hexamita inflata TaxID=28002 RepID=A0AA86RT15_9EUKA|nr:Hypothetical protein HINF_LOCUS59665 [Hexamita inflata]